MPGAVLDHRHVRAALIALAIAAQTAGPHFATRAQAAPTVVDRGRAQCCSSIVPEPPPATYYGATMYRDEDPRSAWILDLAAPSDPPGSIEDMLRAVDAAEAEGGAMTEELVSPLSGLAAAYLAEGRYREGISALRRGIHVARLNDGLHTPAQIEMLEQLIAAHVRQGDYAAADEQQGYLYRVRSWRSPHGSEDRLAATLRYADWMRSAYLGDIDRDRFPRLVGLNDLYDDAIRELEKTRGGDSPEMLPYLQGKVELSYLISVYPGENEAGFRGSVHQPGDFTLTSEAQLRFWRMEEHNFRYGLQALRRREDILQRDPASTPKDVADAHIAIADWYQWHRRYANAIRNYEEAWSMMDGRENGAPWLSATFAEPLELPKDTIFNPGPMPLQTRNDAEVRMRFDVSRHGEAKDITILSRANRDTQPGITRAYHYLRNVRFRPRVSGGSVVRAEDVERRYQIRY